MGCYVAADGAHSVGRSSYQCQGLLILFLFLFFLLAFQKMEMRQLSPNPNVDSHMHLKIYLDYRRAFITGSGNTPDRRSWERPRNAAPCHDKRGGSRGRIVTNASTLIFSVGLYILLMEGERRQERINVKMQKNWHVSHHKMVEVEFSMSSHSWIFTTKAPIWL